MDHVASPPASAATAPPAFSMHLSVLLRSLVGDLGIPLAGFYGLRLLGFDTGFALGAATALAGARIVWVAWWTRRVTWFAVALFTVFGLGLAAALLTGDPRLLVLKDSLGTASVGAAFLVSLRARRPLTLSALQTWQPAGAQALDELYSAHPVLRRAFRKGALIWGIGLLAEALVRVPVVLSVPLDLAVGASAALATMVFGVLGLWTAAHMRHAFASCDRGVHVRSTLAGVS